MYHIKCPYCQERREEQEFNYIDEAFIMRPANPAELSDEEWAEYLFVRKNVRDSCYEQWVHTAGCRKFFIVKRNTMNLNIEGTFTMEDMPAEKTK